MEDCATGAWLRLLATPGLGNRAARALLTAYGSATHIFEQSEADLATVVAPSLAKALHAPVPQWPQWRDTAFEWLAAAEPGVPRRIVTLEDADYPAALFETSDPPLLLYALGRFAHDLRTLPPCLAVVGSRNPTPQGAANAESFSQALAEAGLAVVSGLALGIDGAAHAGALRCRDEQRALTIAVVGTGLDVLYPKRHTDLARRIAQRGLLLSEYPLGMPALAENFPRRNRVIAGLSRGTLVVEAALQSGSLITARLALDEGREVFAIPGSIHSPLARGCHALLRQGAKLVETAQDVLEELQQGGVFAPQPSSPMAGSDDGSEEPCGGLAPLHGAVLAALGFDPAGLDVLIERTGLDTAALQAGLTELELAGMVARLPGAQYHQLRGARGAAAA